MIKTCLKLATGERYALKYDNKHIGKLELDIQRDNEGLFIFTTENSGYQIKFVETKVTFGTRLWYQCPACKRRCAVLYFSSVFACRHCIKPAYASQNGYRPYYLASRIRSARKTICHDNLLFLVDDLMESCRWWPKPANKHQRKFEADKAVIMKLENEYRELMPISYRKYILQ